MIRTLAGRALQALPVLWASVTVVWIFVYILPGDPAAVIAGPRITPEIRARIEADLGLDRPVVAQYGSYLRRLLQGDLGTSYVELRPVGEILSEGAWRSVLLGGAAMALAIPAGIAAGSVSARRRGAGKALLSGLTLAGISMPTFLVGYLLMDLFAVKLDLLPVSGAGSAAHLVLPAVTLAVYPACLIARITSAAFRDQLAARHVTAARARGLAPRSVVWRHAFRNALGPIVTISGLLTASLIGGAVATETVFAWPGLGQRLFKAIAGRDVMVVEGGVLLLTAIVVTANLAVDLAYALIDPRILRDAR